MESIESMRIFDNLRLFNPKIGEKEQSKEEEKTEDNKTVEEEKLKEEAKEQRKIFDPKEKLIFNYKDEIILFKENSQQNSKRNKRMMVSGAFLGIGSYYNFNHLSKMYTTGDYSLKTSILAAFKLFIGLYVPVMFTRLFYTEKRRVVTQMNLHKDGQHVTLFTLDGKD